MSNFISIVACGTCRTCLLSYLQMAGNVPDIHPPATRDLSSWGASTYTTHTVDFPRVCVLFVRMTVHLCPAVYINCRIGRLSFPSAQPIYQLHHWACLTCCCCKLPLTRNFQPESVALTSRYNPPPHPALETIRLCWVSAAPVLNQPFMLCSLLCLCSRGG